MSMVEKVARAILKRRFYDCEPEAYGHREDTFWEDLDPDHILDAHDEARAAIKAMREPTEAMAIRGVHAAHAHAHGHSTPFHRFYGDWSDEAQHVYRERLAVAFDAMIDAALEGEGR